MNSIASRLSLIIAVLCVGSVPSGCGYNTIPTLTSRPRRVGQMYKINTNVAPILFRTLLQPSRGTPSRKRMFSLLLLRRAPRRRRSK